MKKEIKVDTLYFKALIPLVNGFKQQDFSKFGSKVPLLELRPRKKLTGLFFITCSCIVAVNIFVFMTTSFPAKLLMITLAVIYLAFTMCQALF